MPELGRVDRGLGNPASSSLNLRKLLRRDAAARVDHPDRNRVWRRLPYLQRDAPLPRRVPERVRDQIAHGSAEQIRGGVNPALAVADNRYALFGRQRLEVFPDRLELRANVDRDAFDFGMRLPAMRDEQQVVDQIREPSVLLQARLERFVVGTGRTFIAERRFRFAGQYLKRRTQFVGGIAREGPQARVVTLDTIQHLVEGLCNRYQLDRQSLVKQARVELTANPDPIDLLRQFPDRTQS